MQNKSKLKSTKLEFELRLREYIDYILNDKYIEAVKYARTNLSKFSDDEENFCRLKNAMGLLSFKKDRLYELENYCRILSDENWNNLVEIFVQESYTLHSLTMEPLLIDCLNIGVSILKTIFCSDKQFFNESCPTC